MAWIPRGAKTKAWIEREEKKRAEREELLAKEREINRLTNLNKERKRSKKWLEQCENLANIIKKEREINETSLLEQSGLSIWVFKKLKPHLLELYSDIVYYKKEKKYFFIDNESGFSLSFLD
tara:strand:+ start:325 stop:690 length:366 start_codon:yes stop_codon:yes gene_type:complete